ncbi:condensation domain-containing protein [Streptosporangium lutulentum]
MAARGRRPSAGTGSHAVRLRGPLDPGTLATALTTVLGRHEALRTRLADGPGGPLQSVSAEPYLRLRTLDLSDVSAANRAAETARQVARSAGRALDLASGESTRFRLLRLGEDDHVLILAAHLAVFDGWSSAVFLKDLSDAYRGRVCAPPALQFPDFAAWQHRWLDGPGGTAELDHWRQALAGLPAVRPERGFDRGHLPVGLDPKATSAGFALGSAEGATPFMTLLAALAVVLARRGERRGDGRDVVVGTPMATGSSPGWRTWWGSSRRSCRSGWTARDGRRSEPCCAGCARPWRTRSPTSGCRWTRCSARARIGPSRRTRSSSRCTTTPRSRSTCRGSR